MIEDDLPIHVPLRQVLLPSIGDVLVTRALVKDAWLIWTDALPDDESLWPQLTVSAVESVTALAKALHAMHRAMKSYKNCDESPFTVSRWWDPTADDGYDTGKFALLKFKDHSAIDLQMAVPRSSSLVLTPVSSRAPQWVEAWVQENPSLPLGGLGLTAAVTSGALDS